MDPKMRQGSRLKALGDIKELMGEGEAERARPFMARPPMDDGAAPEAPELEGEGELESPIDEPGSPSELSPEDISKLKALLEVMK